MSLNMIFVHCFFITNFNIISIRFNSHFKVSAIVGYWRVMNPNIIYRSLDYMEHGQVI